MPSSIPPWSFAAESSVKNTEPGDVPNSRQTRVEVTDDAVEIKEHGRYLHAPSIPLRTMAAGADLSAAVDGHREGGAHLTHAVVTEHGGAHSNASHGTIMSLYPKTEK